MLTLCVDGPMPTDGLLSGEAEEEEEKAEAAFVLRTWDDCSMSI